MVAGKGSALKLETSDDIPFFFFEEKKKILGGAVLTIRESLDDFLLAKLGDIIKEKSFDPSEIIAYLGPSLSFINTPVARSLQIDLMNKGYRAAVKRVDQVDYLDVQMLYFLQLRKLGLNPLKIHLTGLDTYECPALFYSEKRGDLKKNISLAEIL